MQPKVSKNLPRTRLNLSVRKQARPGDRECHNNGLENNGPNNPSDHRARGILLGLGREKLLIHRLIPQQKQAGRKKELQASNVREIAEDLKVCGRQARMDRSPPSRMVSKNGQSDDHREGSK